VLSSSGVSEHSFALYEEEHFFAISANTNFLGIIKQLMVHQRNNSSFLTATAGKQTAYNRQLQLDIIPHPDRKANMADTKRPPDYRSFRTQHFNTPVHNNLYRLKLGFTQYNISY
jgi:hypothetical protein